MMERIPNRSYDDFPPARVYFDDLSRVVSVFDEYCKSFELVAGDFRITKPAELSDLAQGFADGQFPGVKIQGYDPYVLIEFRPFGISAYVSEDNAEQLGIIAKCREAIADCAMPNPQSRVVQIGANVLFMATFFLLMSGDKPLGLVALCLAAIFLFMDFRSIWLPRVVMKTISRGSETNFFKRRKDEIILATIAAGLGALATYLVTTFLP